MLSRHHEEFVLRNDNDSGRLLERITDNPDVLVGKPTVRGLRISVEEILPALAAGVSEEELLRDYPELEHDDIRAVLIHATERVAEERIFPVRRTGN